MAEKEMKNEKRSCKMLLPLCFNRVKLCKGKVVVVIVIGNVMIVVVIVIIIIIIMLIIVIRQEVCILHRLASRGTHKQVNTLPPNKIIN